MVGHVPIGSFSEKLQLLSSRFPFLKLEISADPMPYSLIKTYLDQADIILLPYKNQANITDKIPTKLYESLALHLPVLFSPNPLWSQITSPYRAGAEVNFCDLGTALESFEQLISKPFYTDNPDEAITWQSEKKKWILLMDQLLTAKQNR